MTQVAYTSRAAEAIGRSRPQPFRNLGPADQPTRCRTGSYGMVGGVAIVAEGRGAHSVRRRHGWADSAVGGAMTRGVARGCARWRGRASAGVGREPREDAEIDGPQERA